ALPESIKAGQDKNAAPVLQEILRKITADLYLSSLFMPDSQAPALIDPTIKKTISHQKLSSFVNSFSLPIHPPKNDTKAIVSLALPNGYLLGLACLAVASCYIAAPLNISGGATQFQTDVQLASPQCILVLESDVQGLGLEQSWVSEAKIQVIVVQLEPDMTFRAQPLVEDSSVQLIKPRLNSSEDIALILFTSGTTGKKKAVPTTILGILLGTMCVVDSCGLTPQDSCINMMPLNHVGGLVRNLFAPVLSGGSSILCPTFDPALFWDIVEEGRGTWYYASPSMHMGILLECSLRPNAVTVSRLRLVCNAAGDLSPALAVRLRDTFKCTVLPSYGMTECMPISTPPLNYALDRMGTSGVVCGPEISILDESDNPCPSGVAGRINVRGGPIFPGYLKNGKIDKSVFNGAKWFDTGDLGMLDNNGFLYLTGRSKEVINRGGEIISPFEVEEAITVASQKSESTLYKRVKQVLAFSAPHEELQEVVGVALVCPLDRPRPDIRDLHVALKSSLHPSKLPMVIVYIDALPTSNNKLVRTKFAERMDMSPITNDMAMIERHFSAVCPLVDSSLPTKIPNFKFEVNYSTVMKVVESHIHPDLDAFVRTSRRDGTIVVYLAPIKEKHELASWEEIIDDLRSVIAKTVDGFLVPSSLVYLHEPFPRDCNGMIDDEVLDERVKARRKSNSTPLGSETEKQVCKAVSEVLGIEVEEMCSSSDFFELGGDSMSAGRLSSILRRNLGVRAPVDQIFTQSRICDISTLVDQLLNANPKDVHKPVENDTGDTKTYSSSNPLVLFINLLPILLIYPMKSGFRWVVFIYALSAISNSWNNSTIPARFIGLFAAMFISRVVTQIVAPCWGITMKWIIIGKYTKGLYPMWGPYHTRWWLVERILQICGQGVFGHSYFTRVLHCRLLGAKIGRGVVIEKGTTIGEHDLIDIADNVRLDRCVCRPFAVERNTTMYLGQITIGRNSSVGLKSHIAAGSILPEGTFIGGSSSSYEMDDAQQCDEPLPKPHFLTRLLFIIPVQVLVRFISSLPWMGGLGGMVGSESRRSLDGVKAVVTWWATPHRIGFHYLALVLNVCVRPFVWFSCIVVIKKSLDFFRETTNPKPNGSMTVRDNFRRQLLETLVPHGNIRSITELFGLHYEFTSRAVRLMGGKVGKRVYWPGTGPSIEDFDLIDIGDDVVFGAQADIVTTDSTGGSRVKIGRGAMIADRVMLSPGVTIGERAVIGSGAFIKRGQVCGPDTVWIGNRKGSAVCLSKGGASQKTVQRNGEGRADNNSQLPVSDETASSRTERESNRDECTTPFGRAFYEGKAPYYVLGQTPIFLYATLTKIFAKTWWDVRTISTIPLSHILNHSEQLDATWYRPIKIYILAVAIMSALIGTLSLLSLATVITAKWTLLGRRKPGTYHWDRSSYCQRWQLCLATEALPSTLSGRHGVLGMLTGTHFLVLYFRALGADIGTDCALFAGGRQNLMFTEPDLVTLGDRVAVDDASLVAHINTRGLFSLNELRVGSRSALRSGSRLLCGASMGEDAVLLEHTLVMAGDVADCGTVYQGWPADVFRGDRLNVVSTGPLEH
ncbi:putative peroxisomal-coenzyme A synthetase, partial [Lachnellula arida]